MQGPVANYLLYYQQLGSIFVNKIAQTSKLKTNKLNVRNIPTLLSSITWERGWGNEQFSKKYFFSKNPYFLTLFLKNLA
jgi:hypothetical protein